MFKNIAIAVVVLIGAILVYAATRSDAMQGDSTNVTWKMDGPSPYLAKVMGVFINMDTMIGKDFETGLTNLKAIAEN